MWDKLLLWLEGYRSAHYVNVILLFFFLDRFSPVLGQSSESSPSPKIVSVLEKFCVRNFVSIGLKLHWRPIVTPHDFLLQTLQFRLVVKELTKGLCWLSGQFQALIEFNSVTEAEIAKLVQRMLLLWLPCLTHCEDKCMTVQVLHCNSISFHFPQTLDGQNIYNSCCTLHLEYSKLTTLTVKFNNDKSKWVYICLCLILIHLSLEILPKTLVMSLKPFCGHCLAIKNSNNIMYR